MTCLRVWELPVAFINRRFRYYCSIIIAIFNLRLFAHSLSLLKEVTEGFISAHSTHNVSLHMGVNVNVGWEKLWGRIGVTVFNKQNM